MSLEKLQSLLGRGRHEQFFQAIGKEIIKFKNIDVASAINRNLNAMQIFERKLKEQAVSGRDLFKIITAVTKKGLDFSIVPTEIGHGWDQLVMSFKVGITQLDKTASISNTIAKIFHGLSQGVATVVDWFKKGSIEAQLIKESIRLVTTPITVLITGL